ncbi:esterase [Streptomyces sp. NPDC049577]|uniref:alpha/beta hydrolase family protein n=1 Tax=Streptomyces sp. NPDC049577 TaxID=3155153 RepID=UPI00342D1BB2
MPVKEQGLRGLRRRALVAAGVLALTGVLGALAPGAHAAQAAHTAPAAGTDGAPGGAAGALELPEPTGPYRVGTLTRRLVDTKRQDPWRPRKGHHREVMVSFWYPAARAGWREAAPRTGRRATAPQMDPRSAAHFGSPLGAGSFNYGIPAGRVDWSATRTHARVNAPALQGTGIRPVVLYSSGLGDPRTWNTSLAEELASRGYVVVTMDHTYDSSEVRFPDGRLATSVLPDLARRSGTDVGAVLRKAMAARVADARFVLDRLEDLRRHHGKAPGSLPRGLADAMDLRHVGMAGHSAGGFTALQTLHDDRRVSAAVNMDGTLEYPTPGGGTQLSDLARSGVDRPYLLMGTDSPDSGDYRRQPSWLSLWRHSRGWHTDLTLTGSRHAVYTDAAPLLTGLARRGVVGWETVGEAIGSVRGERAVGVTRAYVVSFLDRFLRGRDDGLLDGPSSRFPEMRFG